MGYFLTLTSTSEVSTGTLSHAGIELLAFSFSFVFISFLLYTTSSLVVNSNTTNSNESETTITEGTPTKTLISLPRAAAYSWFIYAFITSLIFLTTNDLFGYDYSYSILVDLLVVNTLLLIWFIYDGTLLMQKLSVVSF